MALFPLARPLFPLIFLALCSCEPILTQDPAEHFADGKLPPSAFRLANQIWALPASEKIAARLAADEKNPYLVKVGVMDSGVDYAHPDLVNQIDFGMTGGRVSSAGWDVQGGDRFGGPQVLRYEYYAFGAGGIEGGRIKNPPKDPFALLAKYDREFLDRLMPKLEARKSLRSTLFRKITRENFSIVAAHMVAVHEFDPAAFQRRRETTENSKKLMSPTWAPTAESPEAIADALRQRYYYIHEPWTLGSKGYPVARGASAALAQLFDPKVVVNNSEGGDEFHALVKSEFESYAKASGYLRDFETLVEFMSPRVFGPGEPRDVKVDRAIERLGEALTFKRLGYLAHDPLRELERSVYAAALTRRLEGLAEWPTSALAPSRQNLENAQTEGLSLVREASQYILENESRFQEQEIEHAREFLSRIRTWDAFFSDYLKRRGWDPVKGSSRLTPEETSRYRAHLVRTEHPLLDAKASNHGTHVAGIIARQNESVRIVPIRVTTESTKRSPLRDPEILKEFTEGFRAWLREPLVLRALEGRFASAFPGKKGTELADAAWAIFSEQVPKDVRARPLDYRFLGEVERAIEISGKEKLKLVNVSLGTTFDQDVVDYRNLDIKKQVQSSFQFLKFEYFKWKVGRAVVERAPGTLFLIATGNEGAWRDGRSRSGLPVDLSSPFLGDYEDASKGLVAPNNRIRNILGVGSLSQIDELSSFSNLLISKAPMVMAHGEEVLSPIRALSTDATDRLWGAKAAIMPRFSPLTGLLVNDARLEDFVRAKFGIKGRDLESKKMLTLRRQRISNEAALYSGMETGLKFDLFLRFPNVRARLTGTSMATPTLAGLLASEVQRKIAKAGIPASQLYDHPDFTPTKLIEMVMAKAEPVFKESTVISLKKWTGELTWEKSEEERKIDALFEAAKATASRAAGDPDRETFLSRGREAALRLFRPEPAR